MEIVLIPGFWLDGSSWDAVVPVIEQAGHRTHPMTLPGMQSRDADRSGIGLGDHIDAVVAKIDALDEPVVLVAHSGGGAVAHAAVDARPDRVARVVYTASEPVGEGAVVNDALPAVDGEVPLPEWSAFEEEELLGLDEEGRAAFRARAIPTPVGATRDPQRLCDERRYDVPITVVACEFPSTLYRKWIDEGHPGAAELARIRDVTYVDLPTGHWPQFTRPVELGAAIVAALG